MRLYVARTEECYGWINHPEGVELISVEEKEDGLLLVHSRYEKDEYAHEVRVRDVLTWLDPYTDPSR